MRQLREPDTGSASDAWRRAVARSSGDGDGASDGAAAPRWAPEEVWIEDPPDAAPAGLAPPGRARQARSEPTGRDPWPNRRGAIPASGHRFNVPEPVVDELTSSAGAQRGGKLASRLADATHAYDHERYQEARRILRPLAEEAPGAVAVRELQGLSLYRMGQWAAAARELEAYRSLSGSYDQHPVLADCYRALRRFGAADELWDDLRQASPSAELVAEGRIVAAGCRADRGDLAEAIAVLERAGRRLRHPEDHHLRQWYALADLYERAGDLPRARELFGRIVSTDPDAYDARRRLRSLR